MYRCRIGQFQNNKYKVRLQYRKNSYRQIRKLNLIPRIIRVAFLITLALLSSMCPPSTHSLPYPAYPCSILPTTPSQPNHSDQVLQQQPGHGRGVQVLLPQPGHGNQVSPPQPSHAHHIKWTQLDLPKTSLTLSSAA